MTMAILLLQLSVPVHLPALLLKLTLILLLLILLIMMFIPPLKQIAIHLSMMIPTHHVSETLAS